MKYNRLFLFAIGASILFNTSCQKKIENNLIGDITTDRDTLVVRTKFLNNKENSIDTLVLKNGHFELSVQDSVPVWVNIYQMPRNEEERHTNYIAKLLMLPGDHINVSGELNNLKISKSELYDSLSDTEYYKIYCEKYALDQQIREVYANVKENTKGLLDSLLNQSEGLKKQMNDEGMKLVKSQPKNIASAFATIYMPERACIEASELLDKEVVNGPMKEVIKNNVEVKRELLAKQKVWDTIKEGVAAPDFKLKDINGEERTLSSFKGKYLVLDFWGTWCPWCVKDLPAMRTYYSKYKSKVEFVGINCRDTDKSWREGVKKHNLTWTHLFNGDDKEIIKKYGILGFPSKVLIDPEGKIVDKYIDQEEEFYDKLDNLFGNK